MNRTLAASFSILTIIVGMTIVSPTLAGEKPADKKAEQATFVPLDIKSVATVASTLIFNRESLHFPKWGEQTHHGVSFMVIDPEGGKIKNAICLYSGLGAVSSKMPKAVRLPCDSPAKAIHFLGAAGWGVPWTEKGSLSMLVKLEYEDGSREDHPLLNGVHLTDWAKGPDVSGSKNIGILQVSYFSIVPKRPDSVIRAIEFRKGTDQTSPFVIAATIETDQVKLAQRPKEVPALPKADPKSEKGSPDKDHREPAVPPAVAGIDLSNAKVMGDFVRLHPGGVATQKAYSGPVEITVVARTDKLNIRLLAFRGGFVIFNHENSPDTVYIHRPDDIENERLGSLAFSRKLSLKPDTWYTLRWKITEDGMEVAVDGTLVFSEDCKLDLSKPSPIRVSGHLSVVDVKSFDVRPIPEAEIAAERKKRKEAVEKAEQEWREALAGAFSTKTTGRVNRVFFGEDGKTFASVGKGGVSVWSLAERKLLRTITDKDVCDGACFAISSDGKRSVITGREKTITWDLDQGKVVRASSKTSPHGAGIFSPDARFVALYTEKFNLSLVDLEADKILREIPKPKLDDWAPQFTPDGKRLALYGGDYDPEWLRTRTVPRPGRGEIREFDVESGKEIRSYLGQDGPINRMAYSQDGTLMASVGWTTVRIWDAKAGKQLHSFTRVGPSWLQSTGCAFSPDNKFLACAEGSLLVVWNTTTGQKVFETDKGGCNFAFSHDGKIAWSHDGLHVQDITASKKVLTVKCAVAFRNLGFSPNGRMVALGTEAGLVIVPIPKTALDPAPNLAIGPDLSIGSDRLTAKKLEAIPGARKLVARVKTTSDDNVDKTFTKHLQNLSVSATKTQLVVDFDVDRKKWEPVTRSMSLVVRLLDKDGKYLTHFVTKESVTAQPAVFDGWIAMQNRIPPEVRDKLLPDFTPVLLEPQSNRFIYGVDPAVLRDAAIVEVGFLYVKKGPL